MNLLQLKDFSTHEHNTWRKLFTRQEVLRSQQIVPQFARGLELLNMTANSIPSLEEVNQRLHKLTGWEGVPVNGLEEGISFFAMLARKQFPIGNFIRDERDLSYTPAPDIFHDLYGHIPFYTDLAYAEFCEEFGKQALPYLNNPAILREFERFFWFTIEFGLVKTRQGLRVFGAGIASSVGECEYALSNRPTLLAFDVEAIRAREFRIDVFQTALFVLENESQLYESLNNFVKVYNASNNYRTV